MTKGSTNVLGLCSSVKLLFLFRSIITKEKNVLKNILRNSNNRFLKKKILTCLYCCQLVDGRRARDRHRARAPARLARLYAGSVCAVPTTVKNKI